MIQTFNSVTHTMIFESPDPQSRAKRSQPKRVKHPAFEESDSEDEDDINKAEVLQGLLRQTDLILPEDGDALPLQHKHRLWLKHFEGPIKRLLYKNVQNMDEFTIVKELTPVQPIYRSPSFDHQQPKQVIAQGVRPSSPERIERKRTRRFTVGEAPIDLHKQPFGRVDSAMLSVIEWSRAQVSTSNIDPLTTRTNTPLSLSLTTSSPPSLTINQSRNNTSIPSLIAETVPFLQGHHRAMSVEASGWRSVADKLPIYTAGLTRSAADLSGSRSYSTPDFGLDERNMSRPNFVDEHDHLSITPSVIGDPYSNLPLGLLRFDQPRKETSGVLEPIDPPDDAELDAIPSEEPKTHPPLEESKVTRILSLSKLRKLPSRNMKISAPAPNQTSSFLDVAITIPRTPPPVPVKSIYAQKTATRKAVKYPGSGEATSAESSSGPTLSDGAENGPPTSSTQTKTTNSQRKTIKFQTVVKVAARLLHAQKASFPSPLPPGDTEPALPPLVYTFSVPIEQHAIAISDRVKEECKIRISRNADAPPKDAATEDELKEELSDVNNEVGRCVKEVMRLLVKARGRSSKWKTTSEAKEQENGVRTKINQFLVTRAFQPFSIELSEEENEALRERYLEIAPNVPQCIASRWRVLASSSTSRPIQQLTSTLTALSTELSSLILEGLAVDPKISQDVNSLLLPIIRHAYLFGHFIQLEIRTSDYDVFHGTELGGWVSTAQEETNGSRAGKGRESRIRGYYSLGLRKQRFVGKGASQRRVWDVVVKAKVVTDSSVTT